MKKLFFLTALLSTFIATGQVYEARVLKVDPMNLEKLKTAVAKKTQLFNNKEGAHRYATFQILTGRYANNLYRVRIAENVAALDKPLNKAEMDYWMKETGKLHEPLASRIFTDNEAASYSPEKVESMNHRRVLYYKIVPGKAKHFWRYRTRLVKALAAGGWPNIVEVMNCQSGCNGAWVQVRYYHKNFEGEAADNQMFEQVVKEYNAIYGEDAYEDDSQNLAMAVSESITEHQRMLPAATSSWE